MPFYIFFFIWFYVLYIFLVCLDQEESKTMHFLQVFVKKSMILFKKGTFLQGFVHMNQKHAFFAGFLKKSL